MSSFLFNDENTIGKHPEVVRWMRGAMNKKPPLPRYTKTWDLNIMLDYLKSKQMWDPTHSNPLNHLSLLQLTRRLVILLALTSGKRGQNLHLLDIDFLVIRGNVATFDIRVPVKNYSKVGDISLQTMSIKAYPPNRALCPLFTLTTYLNRTRLLRQSQKLLVISKKPHTEASRSSISRWTKEIMAGAGIDTEVFTPHSTRHASVSKAHEKGIPTPVIIDRAGWKSDCCFAKYYLKPIEKMGESDFQSAVLSCT